MPASNIHKTTLTRYGGWLPVNREIYHSFINKAATHRRRSRGKQDRLDAVDEFEAAIKNSPVMSSLFDQIFLQVSSLSKFDFDCVRTLDDLLDALDFILRGPPSFHVAKDENGNVIGEPVGVPVYLIFDLLSNTGAGYDLFRMPDFNVALKNLLQYWGTYLVSSDSNKTLNDTDQGWFSSLAIAALEEGRGNFETTYVCPDPSAVNRGYASWDEFFTREIQDSARPVLFPENLSLLHNACESTVVRIARDVKEHDQFWLKGQAYSLYDLLNRDNNYAPQFVGGTIYQAFLSPFDYHRWRSPVTGTIVKTVNVPGTYYAALPDEGAGPDDPDLQEGEPYGALIRSQSWLSMNAARALIYIQADNPDVGLMCFIGVGMAEVSTCEVTVREGDRVNVGNEIGLFHFGGSSHTLVFRPQTKVTFEQDVQVDNHLHVNRIIGQFSQA